MIYWSSVTGKWYAIDRSTKLMDGFPLTAGSNIVATPEVNVKTIQVERAQTEFYRVRVE